jgi:hypothetical protein
MVPRPVLICPANKNFLFAEDFKKKNGKIVKRFLSCPIASGNELCSELMENNKHYYEMVKSGEPIKPFFDLELERDDMNGDNVDDMRYKILNFILN